MNAADEAASQAGCTVDIGRILSAVAREIAGAEQRCEAIQTTISSLLEKSDHPDLGAEMHMLQDIDRLQQTLADLARTVALTAAAPGRRVARVDVVSVVRLESLRCRLGVGDPAGVPSVPDTGDEHGIDWF